MNYNNLKISPKSTKNKYPWNFLNKPHNEYFINEDTPEIFKKLEKKCLNYHKRKYFLKYKQRQKDFSDMYYINKYINIGRIKIIKIVILIKKIIIFYYI